MRIFLALVFAMFLWGCDGDVTVGQGTDGSSGVADSSNLDFEDDEDELQYILVPAPPAQDPQQCEAGTGFRIPGGGWCSCESRQAGRC